MSNLIGSNVKNSNYILRLALLFFVGLTAFGSVVFWKSQLMFASEYQEFPKTHEQMKVRKENILIRAKMARQFIPSQIEE